MEVLSYYFLYEFNSSLNKNIKGFAHDVVELFRSYNWPGNIRELKHCIEHAVNITEKDFITTEDLPQYVYINHKNADYFNKNAGEFKNEIIINEELNVMMDEYERKIISESLRQNDYNILKTSRILNVPRQTLYYKMKKLGIRIDKSLEDKN